MNSPRPARRFSRWQTRKRAFVLDGTAFSAKTSGQAAAENPRPNRNHDHDVNEGKLTEEKENDESTHSRYSSPLSKERQKTCERKASPLLDRREGNLTSARKENNIDTENSVDKSKNEISDSVQGTATAKQISKETSFHQSVDKEGDLNESRSLRNRDSIRKPPLAHYPVEFLSAGQKRSVSLKLKKKLFNECTTENALDESKRLSNGSQAECQGVGLVSSKADRKSLSQAHHSEKGIEIGDTAVSSNRSRVYSASVDDGERKISNGSQNTSEGGRSSDSAIPESDIQLTNCDVEDNHLKRKVEQTGKDEISRSYDKQTVSIEQEIGRNLSPLKQSDGSDEKRSRTLRNDSSIEYLKSNQKKSSSSRLEKNGSNTSTLNKSKSKGVALSEDDSGDMRYKSRYDEGLEASSVSNKSQTSGERSGNRGRKSSKSIESNTKADNFTASSDSENALDNTHSGAETMDSNGNSMVRSSKTRNIVGAKYSQREAMESRKVISMNKSLSVTTKNGKKDNVSIQHDVEHETPHKDEPNKSLRQRDSLRKPPSSFYPVEFMSSSLKKLLPSSKSRTSLLNASTHQTLHDDSNSQSRSKRKSKTLDSELPHSETVIKKGRKSNSVSNSNDKSVSPEKRKGTSKVSQKDKIKTVSTGYFSTSDIEINEPIDPQSASTSQHLHLSTDKMEKSDTVHGNKPKHLKESSQMNSKHSEVNKRTRLKTPAPNLITKLPANDVMEKTKTPRGAVKRSKIEKETSNSEKDNNMKSPDQLNNERSVDSNDNASIVNESTHENRSLRNRDSIRKPPPVTYPVEFLSSSQTKALSLLLSKKKINKKGQDPGKFEGTRKAVKKRKYSLPKKKPSKKELGSFRVPEIPDRTIDSTLQVSPSFMMVDTFSLGKDTTSGTPSPNKADKDDTQTNSSVGNGNSTQVFSSQIQCSQPLDDTVHGVHKVRRKRTLFSDAETNPAYQSLQPHDSQPSSQGVDPASDDAVPNDRVTSKTSVTKIPKKSTNSKSKQNRTKAKEVENKGMKDTDASEKKASKTKQRPGSKTKDVISEWMSFYKRLIKKTH